MMPIFFIPSPGPFPEGRGEICLIGGHPQSPALRGCFLFLPSGKARDLFNWGTPPIPRSAELLPIPSLREGERFAQLGDAPPNPRTAGLTALTPALSQFW